LFVFKFLTIFLSLSLKTPAQSSGGEPIYYNGPHELRNVPGRAQDFLILSSNSTFIFVKKVRKSAIYENILRV